MNDDELEHIYRDYIATLNKRRFDDLSRFVHRAMTYNGALWTREKYQSLLVVRVFASSAVSRH